MQKFKKNNLSESASTYLLQHQQNPVHWQLWNDETLQFAKVEHKILFISIGYSACHWCHVMEKECFEDDEVAKILNKDFISIKVDREAQPDVDALYMESAHLLGNQGGWPLTIFALPNGKPFFAGTYFPKHKFISIIKKIIEKFQNDFSELEYIGNNVTDAMHFHKQFESNKVDFQQLDLRKIIEYYKQNFDRNWGGFSKAPKFPLPNAWQFLLQYAIKFNDNDIIAQLKTTLNRMYFGGIYDRVSGGFSRYSVDAYWKIPHFEKMLYDNAQLLSLYSKAYKYFKDENYKAICTQIFTFLQNELKSNNNLYFSALDADSEGVEGKFYVWNVEELKNILEENYPIFAEYFSIEGFGIWEHNQSVLMQLEEDNIIANRLKISVEALKITITNSLQLIEKERNKRVKPNLDKKCITSWNALLISGFCHCYQSFQEEIFLNEAEKIFQSIIKELYVDNQLYRIFFEDKFSVIATLEDYAFLLNASIDLYETTLKINYLYFAKQLFEEAQSLFYHKKNQLYRMRSVNESLLFAETFQINDSVEPSGNAIIATNAYRLGKLFSDENLITHSKNMFQKIAIKLNEYPIGFSQWLQYYLYFEQNIEISVIGTNCKSVINEIQSKPIFNIIFCGSEKDENLPLLENRHSENETLIYFCKDNSCHLPEDEVKNVLQKIY